MTNVEMLELARAASDKAYSPYSGVKVGAVLETNSGNMYTGCNVENGSYGGTICAERTAALKAVSEGDTEFVRIAVAGSIKNLVPCGMCRQFMSEFGVGLEIIYENEQLSRKKEEPVARSFSSRQWIQLLQSFFFTGIQIALW